MRMAKPKTYCENMDRDFAPKGNPVSWKDGKMFYLTLANFCVISVTGDKDVRWECPEYLLKTAVTIAGYKFIFSCFEMTRGAGINVEEETKLCSMYTKVITTSRNETTGLSRTKLSNTNQANGHPVLHEPLLQWPKAINLVLDTQ